MTANQVKKVVAILKQRWPNTTTEETVDIAMKILTVLDEEKQ